MGLLPASILNVMSGVKLAAICEKSIFTRKLLKKMLRRVPVVEDINRLSAFDLMPFTSLLRFYRTLMLQNWCAKSCWLETYLLKTFSYKLF